MKNGKTDNIDLFIDLPNLYGNLLNCNIDEDKNVREYFINWFDINLLSTLFGNKFGNTWVFYSDRRIGPKKARIDNEYLKSFIERINKLPGVSAFNVNIPGEQREPFKYKCDKCGNVGNVRIHRVGTT